MDQDSCKGNESEIYIPIYRYDQVNVSFGNEGTDEGNGI
jgi:hypothetical protein